ncbi:hypothetical protein Mapa_004626 [Marchantia paleacea]|nr:hypothetical protein Mapa_004626 [Marchantia paleacea]
MGPGRNGNSRRTSRRWRNDDPEVVMILSRLVKSYERAPDQVLVCILYSRGESKRRPRLVRKIYLGFDTAGTVKPHLLFRRFVKGRKQ